MLTVLAAALVVLVGSLLAVVARSRRPSTGSATPGAVDGQVQPVRTSSTHAGDQQGGALVTLLRTRPWARRALSLLSVGLLLGAAGVLGYPFYTNLYQDRVQQRLGSQLSSASPELEQAFRADQVAVGDALTRIRIDGIDVDEIVVEGTTASALRAGSGHYPNTPLPCAAGNVAIAGHRTTYGRPFHNLDRLEPGDVITLDTPVGACSYVVDAVPFIVAPTETGVVADKARDMLTLTTCHPKGSADQRLVVTATLQGPVAAT